MNHEEAAAQLAAALRDLAQVQGPDAADRVVAALAALLPAAFDAAGLKKPAAVAKS